MISKEEMEHIASLAKLKLSEDEIEKFTNQFSGILKSMEKLNQIDTENVEAMYQIYDYNQVLREDVVKEGLSRDEVLQNTVEKQYGYFKLLNIMN